MPTYELQSSNMLDVNRTPQTMDRNSQSTEIDAVIVGAGWAGLWTLHSLRQKGFRVLVLESSPDVGGVWQYTKYPGCRNETETPIYQFSAKETWENWHWKERYPTQQEMLGYLLHVVDALDLRKDIVFNCRVRNAQWLDNEQHWEVSSDDTTTVRARFFIPCTGDMTKKYIPSLPGLSTFKNAYHTSAWSPELDVRGKRVGVIGTGSSGSQVIETIGPQVGHLTVFQRTPNLTNPRYQKELTPEIEQREHANYARRFQAMGKTQNGLEFDSIQRNTFDDPPAKRHAVYEMLWARGGQAFWLGNYKDMLSDSRANDEAYSFWRSKAIPRIHNPAHRDLLAPLEKPYAFGAKRPSLESSYFEVYNQSNVDLVDLKADKIQEITPEGIRMTSGSFHALEVLVLATGFDYSIGSLIRIDIRGKLGQSLPQKWFGSSDSASSEAASHGHGGVQTYLGLMTRGFPNMIFPAGPQSPIALGITPRVAEQQAEWVAACLTGLRSYGFTTIEPSAQSEKAWKRMLLEKVEKSLIRETDCWYMSNNIPGRKKEPLFYFGSTPEYMGKCWGAIRNGYAGFELGRSPRAFKL